MSLAPFLLRVRKIKNGNIKMLKILIRFQSLYHDFHSLYSHFNVLRKHVAAASVVMVGGEKRRIPLKYFSLFSMKMVKSYEKFSSLEWEKYKIATVKYIEKFLFKLFLQSPLKSARVRSGRSLRVMKMEICLVFAQFSPLWFSYEARSWENKYANDVNKHL